MSPDVIGVIVAVFGAVATIFVGVYALLSRFETRIETQLDQRFARVDEKFDRVDGRFAQVDEQMKNLSAEIGQVRDEVRAVAEDVVELKVAVARLEGPAPTLLLAR